MKIKIKSFIFFILLFLIPVCIFTNEIINSRKEENGIKILVNNFNNEKNVNTKNDENKDIEVIATITFLERNNFTLPISEEKDPYTLRFCINYDNTTTKFGNNGLTVLAGHRNNYLLGILKYINFGEKIKIKTRDNKEYFYKCVVSPIDYRFLKGENSGYIVNSSYNYNPYIKLEKNYIMIYTCYPFLFGGPLDERFLVYFEITN